jgi:hypothetical protein
MPQSHLNDSAGVRLHGAKKQDLTRQFIPVIRDLRAKIAFGLTPTGGPMAQGKTGLPF